MSVSLFCKDFLNHCFSAINSLTSADLYSPCKRPPTLGIESGQIADSAFFASSFVHGREPHTARLNARYGSFEFKFRFD